jgi:hypothetical protein
MWWIQMVNNWMDLILTISHSMIKSLVLKVILDQIPSIGIFLCSSPNKYYVISGC